MILEKDGVKIVDNSFPHKDEDNFCIIKGVKIERPKITIETGEYYLHVRITFNNPNYIRLWRKGLTKDDLMGEYSKMDEAIKTAKNLNLLAMY